MRKLVIWLIILFLAVSFIAFKARNQIAKTILINSTRSLTDLKLSIEDVDVDIGGHNISANSLKLYNPAGFEEGTMVDIPFTYIDYNFGAALQQKVHFYILKIDLKELLIIRNKNGHLNFMSIRSFQKPRSTTKKKTATFKIDKLYLSIGKVIYKDYFKRETPLINVYNVNLRNQLFENVNAPKALVSTIMHKALMQTDIYQLINFNMNILKENLKDVIDRGGVIIKDFPSKASQAVKDAAKDIKKTIKNIFIEEKE